MPANRPGRPHGKTYGRYDKSCLVPHGDGFKFLRTIPRNFRAVLGKSAWIKTFGKNTSRGEAERAAEALRIATTLELERLKRLAPAELAELEAAGGVDDWRARSADALRYDRTFAPLFEMAARMTPDPDMPDHMQDDDILTAAHARRTLVAIEEQKTRVARIERTLKGEAAPEAALLSLVAVWEKARPQRNCKSAEKSRLYVTRFVEVVGDIDPQSVRRAHVIQFRDALEARGYTTVNISQHLAKLQTLFKTAVSEGVMVNNPAEGVKARRQARDTIAEDDKGFTAQHMQRLFAALDGETPDFQWIIRLLAYHGARSSEICQLKCEDVTTLSGVDVIRIHGKHGSVKNRQSIRDIPVHPKCKAIIAYAAKGAPDAWLFPSLADTGQGRGNNFQKYANGKFLRGKVGITDRATGSREHTQSTHSFRHAFSTACREAEMPDAVKYALMGHALGKGEGGKYGSAPSLKVRAKWLAKVDPLI